MPRWSLLRTNRHCFAMLLACSLLPAGCGSNGAAPARAQDQTVPAAGQDVGEETKREDAAASEKRSSEAPKDKDKHPAHPANRLAQETSPYLLQHAHNPVDWWPWGPEALQKAKSENKPIFLSIGYSSCHWCHVMERESFMDEQIAKILNEHFICIKVDREERPEIDMIYMTALHVFYQATGAGRSGGWPLSMFLTPDAEPFFGGTYFPARDGDRGAAIGFLTIAQRVHETWTEKEELLRTDAKTLTRLVKSELESQWPDRKSVV